MTSSSNQESDVRQSIESDYHDEMSGENSDKAGASEQAENYSDDKHEHVRDGSISSERADDTNDQAQAEHSYFADSHLPHVDDGGDSSSHHGTADEDVFSDKSPRSSLGSYDGVPEPGKAYRDSDNMTTITRSPRISDISQYEREYEKEEFIPTVRGTPRPPFRTPSDVRAMQMSSPTASVFGSPKSTKKHFPTVSRLGTPSASAQYSPKRMSTPPRFKARKESPLVLLHVTLLPLRWVWGDLLNNLDTDEMSDQAKSLRESWRILQDRIGDTVIERGILLGHPQNDYELLEERLLEALELPLRRRARILECGHYLGPSNEGSVTEDEGSEDEWGSVRSRAVDRRHWCSTCKNEIRYDSLGTGKIFRVKVYASNGLMRAGAWAACWKEMERVDVELEPIVEPAVQEELVRLAAAHQERELTHQEEAEIAEEVAQQLKEQHQQEQDDLMSSRYAASPPPPESERARSPISAEERLRRDEERLREIYGHTPPPSSPRMPSREPSVHPHEDSYMPPPSPSPKPQSPPEETYEQNEPARHGYQNASLPELVLQSVRVLMQDRKNVIIFALSVFVLVLALRNAPAPAEPAYEPIVHRMREIPGMRRAHAVDTPHAPTIQVEFPASKSLAAAPICAQSSSATAQRPAPSAEPIAVRVDYEELHRVVHHHNAAGEPAGFEEESIAATPEPSIVASYQDAEEPEPEPEPEVAESVDQEPQKAAPRQGTSATESATNAACYQKPVAHQEEPEAESAPAAPSNEESPNVLSQVTEVLENPTRVSTVYEPCNTNGPFKGRRNAVTLQSEETETETVTEKKVVRVFHTVTEVQTSTETVKVLATEAAKDAAPSLVTEDTPAEESVSVASSEPDELPVAEASAEEVVA
ncbi:hypothetical protein F5Y06DRAFT_174661 [Hypoxylon sp. FL0890]|nr:hypothetical protein F5Y06DRAFT_174661 [Hypoxylon sp. FL0890]